MSGAAQPTPATWIGLIRYRGEDRTGAAPGRELIEIGVGRGRTITLGGLMPAEAAAIEELLQRDGPAVITLAPAGGEPL